MNVSKQKRKVFKAVLLSFSISDFSYSSAGITFEFYNMKILDSGEWFSENEDLIKTLGYLKRGAVKGKRSIILSLRFYRGLNFLFKIIVEKNGTFVEFFTCIAGIIFLHKYIAFFNL